MPKVAGRQLSERVDDPVTLDPDIALWPVVPLNIWPFAGAPTEGRWPKNWLGIDENSALWVCTEGGTPGTWAQVGSGGGGGWPENNGTGPGNLTAQTADDDTVGYNFTDRGSGGFGVQTEGSGGGIGLVDSSGAGVNVEVASGAGDIDVLQGGTGGINVTADSSSTGDIVVQQNGSGDIQIIAEGTGAVSLTALTGDATLAGGTLTTVSGDAVGVTASSGDIALTVSSGHITMTGLPTTNPGGTGLLWNNAGVLSIT